jgi:hypothetical protein
MGTKSNYWIGRELHYLPPENVSWQTDPLKREIWKVEKWHQPV